MSGYILCQTRRAKLPYTIENISTNIYSIEELCFYMYHNIYLLDETIMNEELCFWIRDELGLRKLAAKLYTILDQDPVRVGDFILPVFKEINYLSLDEFRKLNQTIQKFSMEPEVLRQKIKGDYLMEHGKYVNAIKVYQKALHEKEDEEKTSAASEGTSNGKGSKESGTAENASAENSSAGNGSSAGILGTQFVGAIWHNMGCAYGNLFQMDEAIRCFAQAYELLGSMKSMESYLSAVYIDQGEAAFKEKAEELELGEGQIRSLEESFAAAGQRDTLTADEQAYEDARAAKNAGDEEKYHELMTARVNALVDAYRHDISR